MSAELQDLIKEIRADLGADFVATDIVGMDGMSIAGEKARAEFQSELVSAHFAMVMKLAGKVSAQMEMGAVRENQVNTERAIILSRFLGDKSFYWFLAVTKEATLGVVRALMDEYELRLWGAIPS